VSDIVQGFQAVLSGNAFANAFWVCLGIIAGALVQFLLNWIVSLSQRRNALAALRTEIELNLGESASIRARLIYIKERLAAGQIQEADLFLSMQGFDYSIVNPLVVTGHFHVTLGAMKVRRYFEFMRFLNNSNAQVINSMMRTEHERGQSLNYLDWLIKKVDELNEGLKLIADEI
jgi:hypothetical protein